MFRHLVLIAAVVSLGQIAAAQPVDSLSYLLGKFDPAKHADFAEVPAGMASRQGMYLRKDVLEALAAMHRAAAADGVRLAVISAARSFDHQKGIWEGKWNGARKVDGRDLRASVPDKAERARIILRYSSMPGTSRHHWGTDLDLNSLSPAHFRSGDGKRTLDWLLANAHRFGFCQSYTPKGPERPHGYEEEAWHWSYRPVSAKLLRQYRQWVRPQHLSGFAGADALPFEEVMRYVDGVGGGCR